MVTSVNPTSAPVAASTDPVLDAYNLALKNFDALLQKCTAENPPNPMDLIQLSAAIQALNSAEAKLDPKNPDENKAILGFVAATGPDSRTGGLYALLTADAGNISNLNDDIENCQAGNPLAFDYAQLIENLSSIVSK